MRNKIMEKQIGMLTGVLSDHMPREKVEELKAKVEKEILESEMTELEKAATPLFKYLNEQGHPHVTVIVTPTSAELVEGIRTVKTFKHVRD